MDVMFVALGARVEQTLDGIEKEKKRMKKKK